MSKFMRMMILFDLPVKTKRERRVATQFRNFLLKDGFYMIQYSVYARICNGMDDLAKHQMRVARHCPENGSIRMMVLTEKQYEAMDVLVGNYYPEEKENPTETVTIY
jgi:CRISPR-associated protein Cas2